MATLWPVDGIDVEALLATGFRPTPFRQFIIKAHSRCNLACDYCYVYEMADSGWRTLPGAMAAATAARACGRIAEHVRAHGLTEIQVVFHGGEPLLAGTGFFAGLTGRLPGLLPAGVRVDFAVQTNGVLLDEHTVAELVRQRIRIGVSLDGDLRATDRHRRHADGRSSFPAVTAGLRLLSRPGYRAAFAGLLCVVDLDADPIDTYEALLDFAPPHIDFLLPHGNWTQPPKGHDAELAPYGRWLAAAFDRWYGAAPPETHVRLFGEIINLLLGGQSRVEQVGLSPAAMIVVDTDGSLTQVSSLHSAYGGAAATGLDVFRHSFDDALRHPGIVARQMGAAALGDTCRRCPIRRVCGGGYYAHRYRAGSGFRHRSVYCGDLQLLIGHIAGRLRRDIEPLRTR